MDARRQKAMGHSQCRPHRACRNNIFLFRASLFLIDAPLILDLSRTTKYLCRDAMIEKRLEKNFSLKVVYEFRAAQTPTQNPL
jgi:hypothetical protein